MKKNVFLYGSLLVLATTTVTFGQNVVAFAEGVNENAAQVVKVGDILKTEDGVKYKVLSFANGKGTVQLGDGKQAIDYAKVEFIIPEVIRTPQGEFTVTEIGTNAFYSTVDEGTGMRFGTAAEKITIPSTVTTIQKRAFFSADAVKEVTIAQNSQLTTIADEAFYFSALKKIIIPNTVKTIGARAFSFSEQLVEVVIDESSVLESIGDNAFATLKNLKSFYIPKTVKTIGKRVLSTTPKLSHITVAKDNENYKDDNGVLYTKDGKLLMQYPSMKSEKTYKILDETETIAEYAFENNQFLEELFFGKNVKEIKEFAFKNAEALKRVVLNDGLEKIGRLSFYYMSNLTELVFPDSVNDYGNNALYGLEKLEKISFGKNTTTLNKGVLSGDNQNLKEITFYADKLTLDKDSMAISDNMKPKVFYVVYHQSVKDTLMALGIKEDHISLKEKNEDAIVDDTNRSNDNVDNSSDDTTNVSVTTDDNHVTQPKEETKVDKASNDIKPNRFDNSDKSNEQSVLPQTGHINDAWWYTLGVGLLGLSGYFSRIQLFKKEK